MTGSEPDNCYEEIKLSEARIVFAFEIGRDQYDGCGVCRKLGSEDFAAGKSVQDNKKSKLISPSGSNFIRGTNRLTIPTHGDHVLPTVFHTWHRYDGATQTPGTF